MDGTNRWKGRPQLPEQEPLDDDGRQQEESPEAASVALHLGRLRILVAFFAAFLLVLALRLAQAQLFRVEGRAEPAVASAASESLRGSVVDRNAILLAADGFVGEVAAYPVEIQKQGLVDRFAISLTRTLKQSPEAIRLALNANQSLAVLAKAASPEQCAEVNDYRRQNLVWCKFRPTRAYPQGVLAAHAIGFTNAQHEGYGVEASYDGWLRTDGEWQRDLPGHLEPIPEAWNVYLPSPAGRDIVLNIDAPLQYMVEKRLRDGIATYWADSGTVIIMDPRTGAVLAMANYPTFDPNRYGEAMPAAWINAAIGDMYEPGSVFKVVTMAAALDTRLISPETQFVDEGSFVAGGQPIHNAENRVYGEVTAREALAKSINVISSKISFKLGAHVFYNYVRQFGFGKVTEVDLGAESAGIVNSDEGDQPWNQSKLARNSFGQGISVTALQMIQAGAAIANKGIMMQPQMVRGLVKDGQLYLVPPQEMRRPIHPEAAYQLTQMMIYNVESATLHTPVPGYRVAGKTGTAEIPTKEGYTEQTTITSFLGFLPAADPQLVILVKLVRPRRYRWAEQVVTPMFAQIGQDAVQILGIKPDDRMP